jgi:hypothetical protein
VKFLVVKNFGQKGAKENFEKDHRMKTFACGNLVGEIKTYTIQTEKIYCLGKF